MNGKGSRYRRYNRKKFDAGYDNIKWPSKRKEKNDGTSNGIRDARGADNRAGNDGGAVVAGDSGLSGVPQVEEGPTK